MFKDNLVNIKTKIDSFTGNQKELMFTYIQRKLDRSFENYSKEIDNQINYLLNNNVTVSKIVGKR